MALTTILNENSFGVGDRVKVIQKIKEGDKHRLQAFEGIVLGIKGREENKSFTVRRIGSNQIGIERIFPLSSPAIKEVLVLRKGVRGTRRAKLYYTRGKSRREIEKIYTRSLRREKAKTKVLKVASKHKKPSK